MVACCMLFGNSIDSQACLFQTNQKKYVFWKNFQRNSSSFKPTLHYQNNGKLENAEKIESLRSIFRPSLVFRSFFCLNEASLKFYLVFVFIVFTHSH